MMIVSDDDNNAKFKRTTNNYVREQFILYISYDVTKLSHIPSRFGYRYANTCPIQELPKNVSS